jgi:contact-dependent growth inhibition (CDI) system CdiI-like immunity protein
MSGSGPRANPLVQDVPTYDQLREFFLAYFNPDWDLDPADPDAVIDEFLAVADLEHVGDVRRDAQRLLEDTPESRRCRPCFSKMVCPCRRTQTTLQHGPGSSISSHDSRRNERPGRVTVDEVSIRSCRVRAWLPSGC